MRRGARGGDSFWDHQQVNCMVSPRAKICRGTELAFRWGSRACSKNFSPEPQAIIAKLASCCKLYFNYYWQNHWTSLRFRV